MKNVITALANPELNQILKNEKEIKIEYKDIQYQDGVIEILKENEKIDILILSEILPGKLEIKEFILEIKKYKNNLEIILFLEEQKIELEEFLQNQGIYNIYYNNEIDSKQLINRIKKEEKNEELELIKNIIKLEQSKFKNKINNNKLKFKLKNKLVKIRNKIKKENKIITICGSSGTGKSIFTINLAMSINKKKILIIDLDILNNCIHTILGIQRKNKKEKITFNNLIVNYNKEIDVISMVELIENKLIDNKETEEFFENLKLKYDYIIIDTSLECFWKENRKIMEKSLVSIFLVEPNLIEIKKSKRILEIYEKEWKIPKEKIKIIFNKYNVNSVNQKLLKKIFSEYKIIGKINFNLFYNILINKNYKCQKELNNIKKEYKNIIEKI